MQVVTVLSGGFMDLMLDPAVPGLVDLTGRTVMLWGTGDEPFDLTTVEYSARCTARVATDPADLSGLRYLSGERTTFNTIIAETERLTGTILTRQVLGTAEDLRRITDGAADPWSVVPPQWYLLSMLTVPPFPANDNDRVASGAPGTWRVRTAL